MQRKLIMLAGSAPGAGKSTLSEFLFDQFTRHSIPTRWIYEEDILRLDAFAPVVQAFQHSQGNAIEALLAATRQFVHDTMQGNAVIVTDSIFPAYTWLFAAGYPHARIAGFSTELARLLGPLQPLTIYLNSDVGTSLNRAISQRGTSWLDDLIATMQTYTYCQTHPVRERADVIAFFESVTQLSVELFADWPHAMLVLDTTASSLDQITTTLRQHFCLSEQAAAPKPTAAELHPYVGVYVPGDTTATAPPLAIRLVDGELMIDSYWPNGWRLILEQPDQFRLQSTNRLVVFNTQKHGEPRWLTYIHGGMAHHYDKTSKS